MLDRTRAVDETDDRVLPRLDRSHTSIGQMVYDVLREAILQGRLAPGERLRQATLAEAMGVSRIPVRSALLQLESQGLVSYHPHRGATVRTLNQSQIREIYEIRELLESYALRRGMQTMTPERLKRLRQLVREFDDQWGGEEFIDARDRFYRELYNGDDNPYLVQLIEDLRGRVGRYLLGQRIGKTNHRELVRLVAKGDVDAAEALLRAHLAQLRDGIEQLASSCPP